MKSEKEKFEYINKHLTYATLNSWNRLYSIARNVKLHNIGLTKKQYNIAFEMLEMQEYLLDIECILNDFKYDNPEYVILFNGRSGGYMVLYKKSHNKCAIFEDLLDCDTYEHFKECYEDDTSYLIDKDYEIVKAFDNVVDNCIETLKYYCDNFNIEEEETEEKIIVKTKKLVYKEV